MQFYSNDEKRSTEGYVRVKGSMGFYTGNKGQLAGGMF